MSTRLDNNPYRKHSRNSNGMARNTTSSRTEASPGKNQTMEPILSHFRVLGLWKDITQAQTEAIYRKLKPRGILLLFYLLLGIAIKLICSVWFTLQIYGMSKITGAVSDIFEMVVAYGTIGHFLYNRDRIVNAFQLSWNSVENFSNLEIMGIRRRNVLLCILPWFYLTSLCGYSICSLNLIDDSMVTKTVSYFTGKDVKSVKIAIRVVMFLAYNLTRFLCVLSMVFYVSLCLQMNVKLKKLSKLYKDVSDVGHIKPETMKYLVSLWDGFCTVVTEADDIYSGVVALWYADLMHRMIFYTLQALEYLSGNQTTKNLMFGTIYLILVCFYLVLMTVITLSAAGISDMVDNLQHSVRSLCCRLPFQADNLVYNNAIILISSFNNPNIHLTGWNCFIIRRYILLTALGMALSYMMIIKQILK